MSTCSVRINNNSAATLFYFICRSIRAGAGVTPVWQTDELPPTGSRHITWDADDVSFAWADMGPIGPDTRFEIGGTLPADGTRRALLEKVSDDVYTLMPSADGPTPPPGAYLVTSSASIPPHRVAVGLTLGGNVFVAGQIEPNLTLELVPGIGKLALVRSKVVAPVGLMVPPGLLAKAVEIDFDGGTHWVATCELDDTWTITPA